MSSIIFQDLRIFSASQFKESVNEPSPNTKIFLAVGKCLPWANDASPDVPTTTQNTKIAFWDSMIGGKELAGGEIQHVIPKFTWTANTKYTSYNHLNPSLLDGNTQFYVVNSNWDVFKCLSNNYSANSTVQPTSIITDSTFQTSDGYIWKYMYTIGEDDEFRFVTDNYIPVKTLSEDDGSLQWQVQSNAVDGGIHDIIVTSPGDSFTNANTVTITISGDGTGAVATANINVSSNVLRSIVVTNPGVGYTFASISISGGANAAAEAIISPNNGHGSNPLYELGGRNLVIYSKLQFDEDGKIPTTNDYRQVALLKDPYNKGTSNIISNTVFSQATKIWTVGSGDYYEDEYVYQGSSLANYTFKGAVLKWDSANSIVYLLNTTGTPTTDALIGATSVTSRFVSNIELGELEENTGQILYLNNIQPVTRYEDQQEVFQIVLKF